MRRPPQALSGAFKELDLVSREMAFSPIAYSYDWASLTGVPFSVRQTSTFHYLCSYMRQRQMSARGTSRCHTMLVGTYLTEVNMHGK